MNILLQKHLFYNICIAIMRNAFNVKMKREEKIDLASNKNVYFVLIPIAILKKKVYFKILGPRSFHCCYLCVFPFIVALWKIQCKGIFLELQWPFVYVITENFSFYHFCIAMVRNVPNIFFFFFWKKEKEKKSLSIKQEYLFCFYTNWYNTYRKKVYFEILGLRSFTVLWL